MFSSGKWRPKFHQSRYVGASNLASPPGGVIAASAPIIPISVAFSESVIRSRIDERTLASWTDAFAATFASRRARSTSSRALEKSTECSSSQEKPPASTRSRPPAVNDLMCPHGWNRCLHRGQYLLAKKVFIVRVMTTSRPPGLRQSLSPAWASHSRHRQGAQLLRKRKRNRRFLSQVPYSPSKVRKLHEI